MHALTVTIGLLAVLTAYHVREYVLHQRNLARIRYRIHVNGIRGKSSVTRLIAGGLRAGGLRTVAKTTGTKPRFIYPDGTEVPVVRAGKANVIEQVRIVRRAAQLRAEALVVECMAIRPELQSLLEDRMIRSTHGVITNARADHLDQMGPTVDDVARNLARTVPRGGSLFTPDRTYAPVFADVARQREAVVHVVDGASVDDAVLERFGHLEHAENVAVALAVCEALGVPRETALRGMVEAAPDPGALRAVRVRGRRGDAVFVNGFAINDPDSYVLVWRRLAPRLGAGARLVPLVVCRGDRLDRSRQLGETVAREFDAERCVVAGASTGAFVRAYRRAGGRAPLTDMEGAAPPAVVERVLDLRTEGTPVFYGMGNIVGYGEAVVEAFMARSIDRVQRGDEHADDRVDRARSGAQSHFQ